MHRITGKLLFLFAATFGGLVFAVAQNRDPPTSPPFTLTISMDSPIVSSTMPVMLKVRLTNTSQKALRIVVAQSDTDGHIFYALKISDSNGITPSLTTAAQRNLARGASWVTDFDRYLAPGEFDDQFFIVNRVYALMPGTYTVQVLGDDGGATSDSYATTSNTLTFTVVSAARGDFNADGNIDSKDLAIIEAVLNTQTLHSVTDGRDLNGDGAINTEDARLLTTLCTNPRCAAQ